MNEEQQYIISGKIPWKQTYEDLFETFAKWGVTSWHVTEPKGARYPNMYQSDEDKTVTLTYQLRGRTVHLTMGTQKTARANLRVLYLAVEAMRMNEKRGVADVVANAYLQLGSPEVEKDPYEVLNLFRGAPLSVCEAMYRELLKKNHPDVGGTVEKVKELNEAIKKIREANNGKI